MIALEKEVIDQKLISRNLLLYVSGRLISLLGTYMFSFAVGLYVLKLTGSGTSFAISILFGLVPRIILSPVAGIVADKVNRKKMTVLMDLLSGILLIAVFIISFSTLSLPIIYFSSAMLTIFNTFFGISMTASIPNLVDQDNLVKINSLSASIDSGSSIAGPILGGIIYAILGMQYFLLLNGISFIISGISEMFIDFNVHQLQSLSSQKGLLDTMKEGYHYIKNHDLLIGILKYALFLNFIVTSINIYLPYTSIEVIKASSTEYGFIQMGLPLGVLIMSLIYSSRKKDTQHVFKQMAMGMVFLGMTFLTFSLVSSPLLEAYSKLIHIIMIIVISLIMGMIIISVNIPIQIMMQTSIDDAYRGRVSGVTSMFSQMITPFGILLFGFLIDHIPSYLLPIISGILILTIAMLMLNDKKMMKI